MTDANAPRTRGEDVEALLGVEPLKVGDRVRTHYSAECPMRTWAGHSNQEAKEGAEAIVRCITDHPTHPYTIDFVEPKPLVTDRVYPPDWPVEYHARWGGDWCARWELSRLS